MQLAKAEGRAICKIILIQPLEQEKALRQPRGKRLLIAAKQALKIEKQLPEPLETVIRQVIQIPKEVRVLHTTEQLTRK